MSSYRRQIRAALDAVHAHPSRGHSWFGVPAPALPRALVQEVDVATLRAELCGQLEDRLYSFFYVCSQPRRPGPEDTAPPHRDDALVAELSAANTGSGSWQSGWQLAPSAASRGDATVLVRRQGLTLQVAPDEYEPQPDTATVRIRFPREQPRLSPGFYMAHGDAELLCSSREAMVRLYWNAHGRAAIQLMAGLTTRLNAAAVPFQLKVMDGAHSGSRCDRAVLYLRCEDWARAVPSLAATYRAVGARLRPATPALTRTLAPGLGLAENPSAGSFGKHRCRLLADALFEAHDRGATSIADRERVVEERFARAGVDLEAPYLNRHDAGNADPYPGFAAPASTERPATPEVAVTTARVQSATTPIETALQLGRQLEATAIWNGDHCTWLGPESAAPDADHVALDEGIYRGAAGVALFLGETARVTGDPALRRTALGAARQALARAERSSCATPRGLHAGLLGTALGVARVGASLREAALLRGAGALVERVRRAPDDGEFDVTVGLAGGVLSLCALHDLLDDPRCLEHAHELGAKLLAAAEPAAHGWSWRAARHHSAHNLTGYSHGTSGAAHALLELQDLGGEARCAAAAARAFAYEQHWFDAEAANWPDFREASPRAAHFPTMTAWCHGAPGIALARLRAVDLHGDDGVEAPDTSARVALATTQRAVTRQLDASPTTPISGLSLCHGLAGNADVLLEGERILGRTRCDASAARAAGDTLTARCATGNFAAAFLEQHGPGLMTGLAGLGYFALRCADADTPSILAVSRQTFGRVPGPKGAW